MLSAIIVNFRSSDLIDDCVVSLLEGSLIPDEIIVVDNEGRDGGLAPALAGRSDVRIIVNAGNPGYAAACNAGAASARGDVLLFLNADIRVGPDALARCVAAMEEDRGIGAATCRLVRPDGRLDHAAHRGLPTPLASFAYKLGLDRIMPRSRSLARYRMAWLDPTTDHDIEACSGAFLMTRRDVFEESGRWDERYRFYAEDLDLCLRIGRAGHRIRYVGSISSTHLKSAFTSSIEGQAVDPRLEEVRRWVRREVVASHRLFFEEHLRPATSLPATFAILVLFSLQRLRLDASERLGASVTTR